MTKSNSLKSDKYMETTKILRNYVAPTIGLMDIWIERGFGDSFPGGKVEPMSFDDETNENY